MKNTTSFLFLLVWVTFSAALFQSCYEGKVDPSTGEETDVTDDDTVDDIENDDQSDDTSDACDKAFSFSDDIARISSDKCDSCHPSLSSPDTTLKSGWSGDITEIIKRLKGDGSLMPQGGPALASSTIAEIELWADCDFPD